MAKKELKKVLNPRQEKFCQNFVSSDFFGNGVQSYIDAYEPDMGKPNAYNTARAVSSTMLTNVNILARINELFEASGFNDAHIDKQLLIVINQNADFPSKVRAISEYNKLKSRITDKIQLSGNVGVYKVGYKKKEG